MFSCKYLSTFKSCMYIKKIISIGPSLKFVAVFLSVSSSINSFKPSSRNKYLQLFMPDYVDRQLMLSWELMFSFNPLAATSVVLQSVVVRCPKFWSRLHFSNIINQCSQRYGAHQQAWIYYYMWLFVLHVHPVIQQQNVIVLLSRTKSLCGL